MQNLKVLMTVPQNSSVTLLKIRRHTLRFGSNSDFHEMIPLTSDVARQGNVGSEECTPGVD